MDRGRQRLCWTACRLTILQGSHQTSHNSALNRVILPIQLHLTVFRADHLHWDEVRSRTQTFNQFEHDSLAAVHLGSELLVIKQIQVSHCQINREAFEEFISVRILQGLKHLTDHFNVCLFHAEGCRLEGDSGFRAQYWLEVFVCGFDEIEPVLPRFLVAILDLTAINIAKHAFNSIWVIFFELDLVLLALL